MRNLRLALLTLLALILAAGAWAHLTLPARTAPGPTPGHPGEVLKFPTHFLWGVATAGQQIESQQPSDWTAFERDVVAHHHFAAGKALGTTEPGNIRNLGSWSETVRTQKTGFDTLYAEDIDRVAGLGVNSFRFSVDWARLFPRAGMTAPDPDGIAYYRRILDDLKQHNIAPFVTLFHVTTPDWFWQPDAAGKRGWERADAVALWSTYVAAAADAFVPDVEYWCTLNEPMVSLYSGYLEGSYPPLEHRPDTAATAPVIEAMLKAHAAAYRILHETAAKRQAKISVGITQAVMHVAPLRNWDPLDRLTARYVDRAWNWDFLDAIRTGRMVLTSTDIDREIPGLKGSEDYVGLNYYMRMYIASDLADPGAPKTLTRDLDAAEAITEIGWTIDPHGFHEILTEAAKRYAMPIYVLENGTCDSAADDVTRQKYLVEHVRELWLAMQDGADIRSYMQWSLIDNFEWTEGFDARFGLVAVDYEHGFQRTPRPSAALYGEIIHAGGLTDAVVQRYAAMAYPLKGR